MKLMRHLVFVTAATLGLLTPLGGVGGSLDAKAAHGHVHVRYYSVYVRQCRDSPWIWCGSTADYNQAAAYAYWYRLLGYEVYVY
jgi:hypothetical protein